ncbi:serine hydrolase domain-containing protein [Microbacterium sp. NPDC019599]|uniref:serine hydrolase domain-containing protein n=1 Tax=Microbacterium sp. NPDC019599 TaxID=3154690 RepID=UPI0033D1F747
MSDLSTRARAERRVAAVGRHLASLSAARARRGLPEPQILLRTPDDELAWGERDQPFHAASIGKIMTATLAVQLAERGMLDLDAPLPRVLPGREWAGLFVVDGVERAASVTVRRLMAHTSGAADYFEGPTRAARPFVAEVAAERDRLWAPGDLLDYSRRNQDPVGEPGAGFSYSDTGYVLLGRVVEEAGGASLGAQLHERIFGPVGMTASCLQFHTMPGGSASPASPGEALGIAPLWVGDAELSRARSLSCDWGGGGVVTTVDDLLRFSEAWTSGELVGEASRERMSTARHRFRPGIHYGEGVMELRYGGFMPLLAGMPRAYGHLGVTGAHLFAIPDAGIRLAMNFHSTREMTRSFRTHIRLVQHALRHAR